MNRSLCIIVVLFCFFEQNAQTVPSSCEAPDSIVNMYRKSADKLAVRRSDHIGDTWKDSVSINPSSSNMYLEALLAVYHAKVLRARDTIQDVPILLDKYPLALNLLSVNIDSTKTWLKNLKKSIFPTGEPQADSVIDKYKLYNITRVHDYFGVYKYHNVMFETFSNWNMLQMSKRFNGLAKHGVISANPDNEAWTYAYNITDSVNTDFIELTYSLGWGETFGCHSPFCPFRRYWVFRVSREDCSVEYRGSYGTALPPGFVFAGLGRQVLDAEIRISPNPSSEQLRVLINSAAMQPEKLEILNITGQKVYEQKGFSGENEVNIGNLPPGIYFLRIQDKSGRTGSRKFIKE